MSRCRSLAAAATLLLGLVTAIPATPASAQSLADLVKSTKLGDQALFGSKEFRADSLKGLPQWQRVLKQMREQRAGFVRCAAQAEACTTPIQKAWRGLVQKAKKLDRNAQIKAVNAFFNRIPYRLDSVVYGTSEYWATPAEFMSRSGDCEDFAIAKFFALRQLGFQGESLRVVILWDEIRNIGHSVLAVYRGEEILILDNLSELVVTHQRYKHYIPQYSMNETTRWAHVHKKKIPTLVARRS